MNNLVTMIGDFTSALPLMVNPLGRSQKGPTSSEGDDPNRRILIV